MSQRYRNESEFLNLCHIQNVYLLLLLCNIFIIYLLLTMQKNIKQTFLLSIGHIQNIHTRQTIKHVLIQIVFKDMLYIQNIHILTIKMKPT